MRAIEAVRKQLPAATDFARLYELFEDRVGRAPELWEHSHEREHELLLSISVHLARQLQPRHEPRKCVLFEVGDTGFWHGLVLGDDTLAVVFYDDRTRMGLEVVRNAFGSGHTAFVRFRPTTLGDPGGFVIEPGKPSGLRA